MAPRKPSPVDKDLIEGRQQRHALLLIWAMVAAVGVLIIVYGQYKIGQARASVHWPVVPGTMITSQIKSHTDDEGHVSYYADIDYVYTVQGKEYHSYVVVLGGHEYSASQVVGRYPVGETVDVAYDPDKPGRSVLEPGVESRGPLTTGISMILGSLIMGTLLNFLLRRSMKEEKNLLDKILILIFTITFFPLIVCKGNLWALAGMLTVATCLMLLELHPVVNIPLMVFVAFYGIIFALMLWMHFMGWFYSLVDKS